MLFFISLPLMFEAPLVLKWWLGIVPEHTVNFLRLILCSSMLITLSNPLVVSVHATGRIKRFQAIEGTMLLCIVPIAYLLLKLFGIPPEYVFCVHIVVEACTQYVRMRIVLPMIGMRIADYVHEVIFPILRVVMISPIIPLIVFLSVDKSVCSFLLVCVVTVLSVLCAVYFVGCTKNEQRMLKDKLFEVLQRFNKTNDFK